MSTHALIALALVPWLTSGSWTTGPAERATVTPMESSAAPATLGEESFGNDPVQANKEWAPGVLAVANDPSRVYRRWINGNEDFCFRGGVAELERCLAAFARIEAEPRVVRLVTTAGVTESFEAKRVDFDWRLSAPSGIFKAIAAREGAPLPTAAVLTVHLASDVLSPDRITWPEGLVLVGPEARVAELRAALAEAKGPSAKAFGLGELGELPGVDGAYEALRPYLDGDDEWLQLVAAGNLAKLGKRAEAAVERLGALIEAAADVSRRGSLEQALATLRANAAKVDDEAAVVARAKRAVGLRELLERRAAEAAARDRSR